MKTRLTMLVLAGLLTLAFPTVGAADPGTQVLSEKDRGKTVNLRLGDRLILKLRNPASGGYTTNPPVFDAAILELMAQKSLPPEAGAGKRLGDFGQFYYDWETKGVGETDIVITIYRPWEKKPPEEFWRVKVKVGR